MAAGPVLMCMPAEWSFSTAFSTGRAQMANSFIHLFMCLYFELEVLLEIYIHTPNDESTKSRVLHLHLSGVNRKC